MTTLPEAGFTPREAELIVGIPYKGMYQLIRRGAVESYRAIDGSIRVSREELYRYARRQARIKEAMSS